MAFAGLVLSLVLALLLPKTYRAQAVFQPPTTPDSLPTGSLLMRQDPSDLYLGLLASRSVADSVIDQVHLKDVYHVKYYVDARARLDKQASSGVSKNTLISISVETTDPQLSANIANAYLDALYKLKGSMSASASAHRSQFFLEQLDAEREQLAQAEADMQSVQEKTGLILPESEAAAGLSNTARLQTALQDAQTRLSALLSAPPRRTPRWRSFAPRLPPYKSRFAGSRPAPPARRPRASPQEPACPASCWTMSAKSANSRNVRPSMTL
jgi:tyrosine-protein kinase Etk/Wzc